MAIVAELIRDFGLRVGMFGDRFDQLFKECRGKSWLSLEICIALIGPDSFRLVDVNEAHRHSPDTSTLYVPCAPIIARLRLALTATEVDNMQGHPQFSPTSLSEQSERRGKL